MAFLPTSRKEMKERGWEELDVLFISGDAYIDHPAFGSALLARLLESEGFRVGILAQPDWTDPAAFRKMGRPRLFAAISAGAMDSMVNHYTAAKKIRRNDAYTPGGIAGKRPNRAIIAYTAAVKGAFKGLPTVIGGIEASLRRLAHYDYWSDKVRRSILIDSKADLLIYGMAETALLEITRRLDNGEPLEKLNKIRGTALMEKICREGAIKLPSFENIVESTDSYNLAFKLSSEQENPFSAKALIQPHGTRNLIINPPALPLSEAELDRIYDLPFARKPHPEYSEKIPAFEQIRYSITSHRGCFGGCAFCAITHHQGKTIQSRSEKSILREIDKLASHDNFHGTISDIGGPTANMYGLGCSNHEAEKTCQRPSCIYPAICKNLTTDDQPATSLLKQVRQRKNIKHTFIASGIRYDLLPMQPRYFADLLQYHVSGLLKVAPESTCDRVTAVMRKPGAAVFTQFLEQFRQYSRELGLRQAVVPYLISNHPGCTLEDMVEVALYLQQHQLRVEQVQDFTPTPGSLSTCIYYTGKDPFSNKRIHVPRTAKERQLQKALLLYHRA
ncbi:MAG: YgiQ family radical SAM protein, partial [Desulfuromusa sp.]|nr:YgiQ family radical SAM protein [Desulfuromusa sp.]